MKVFEEIDSPPEHQTFSKQNNVKWFTWSNEINSLSPMIRNATLNYGSPEAVTFKSVHYKKTFTINLNKIDNQLSDKLVAISKSMQKIKLKNRLFFFDKLINDNINADSFHFLFAAIRSQISLVKKNQMASLYPPLESHNPNDDFPLHCDFYGPLRLWNIFEDVAPDKYGATILLCREKMIKHIMPRVTQLPSDKKKRIISILNLGVIDFDEPYPEFFLLLHDKKNKWTVDLEKRMNECSLRIKFKKGQGYMIHDRRWLHGRERTFQEISTKRLHRLLF